MKFRCNSEYRNVGAYFGCLAGVCLLYCASFPAVSHATSDPNYHPHVCSDEDERSHDEVTADPTRDCPGTLCDGSSYSEPYVPKTVVKTIHEICRHESWSEYYSTSVTTYQTCSSAPDESCPSGPRLPGGGEATMPVIDEREENDGTVISQ